MRGGGWMTIAPLWRKTKKIVMVSNETIREARSGSCVEIALATSCTSKLAEMRREMSTKSRKKSMTFCADAR